MSETVNTNAIDIIRTAVSAVILILKKIVFDPSISWNRSNLSQSFDFGLEMPNNC